MTFLKPSGELKILGALIPRVVLASSSPNRKALLMECGVKEVDTYSPNADESIECDSISESLIKNAKKKMENYSHSSLFIRALPALSADTLVEINGRLLGKPKTREDAINMLFLLSGKEHHVYTGCGIYDNRTGKTVFFCDKASLIFKSLSKEEILSYIDKNEWMGAAGGYRLQKSGVSLIESIDGDWTTIVGLPIKRIISYFNQPKSSS